MKGKCTGDKQCVEEGKKRRKVTSGTKKSVTKKRGAKDTSAKMCLSALKQGGPKTMGEETSEEEKEKADVGKKKKTIAPSKDYKKGGEGLDSPLEGSVQKDGEGKKEDSG